MSSPSTSPRIVAWPEEAAALAAWGFAISPRAVPPEPPIAWPASPEHPPDEAPLHAGLDIDSSRAQRRFSPSPAEASAWAATLAGLLAEHGVSELMLIASHDAAFEAAQPDPPARRSAQSAETGEPGAAGWRSSRLTPGSTPLARAIDRWLKGDAGPAGLRLAAADGWLIMVRQGGLAITAPVNPERWTPFGLDGA